MSELDRCSPLTRRRRLPAGHGKRSKHKLYNPLLAARYPSTRPYRGLAELDYPFHDKTIHVTNCGRICLHRKKINLSTVFAGQAVGIKEVEEGIWLVSFMEYDLGYIDLEEKTLQPLVNPFGPKV